MKAAWDWHLPVETERQQKDLGEFAVKLGFDTLVLHEPSRTLRDAAADLGIRVVAIRPPGCPKTLPEPNPIWSSNWRLGKRPSGKGP